MAITVRDLLRDPTVQLTLRAGAAGLDRRIAWVHTSDLPEPWRYVAPGEVLLTNGTGMTADPARQARFVRRLAATGASAIGVGLGVGPALAPEALRAADDAGLPLFTIAREVRFSVVARLVAEANATTAARESQRVARLYELLHETLRDGGSLTTALDLLGPDLGMRLCLVDAMTGAPIDPGPVAGPARVPTADVARALLGAEPGEVVEVHPASGGAGDEGTLAVLPLPGVPARAVVVEPTSAEPAAPALLRHLATALSLESVGAPSRTASGPRELARLLAGALDDDQATALLARHGLDPSRCVVVAGLRHSRREPGARTGRPSDGLLGLRHLALHSGDRGHWVVEAPSEARPATRMATPGWALGVSAPLRPHQAGLGQRVAAAREQAEWGACAAALLRRGSLDVDDAALAPLPNGIAACRALEREVLGAVLDHDARRGTAYLATVRAYLDDRSWSRTAAALRLHKQSLGYRLRRIEALSGRGFTATADLALWWAGLQAHELGRLAEQWWPESFGTP
jgi:purine catabolism regulator